MWLDNITLVLREIFWDVMDWIDLAQDTSYSSTILNRAMNVVIKISFYSFQRGTKQIRAAAFHCEVSLSL